MNEWIMFIMKLAAIILLLWLEDYLFWRLYILRCGARIHFLKILQPRDKPIFPPRNNPSWDCESDKATDNKSYYINRKQTDGR
jgi:hypothetical protein